MIRVIRIIHQHLQQLVIAAFTKKEERQRQHTHKLLLSTGEFVCESDLFYASCICQFKESRNQYHADC